MHDAVERTHGVVRCDGRLLDAADTTHTCADTVFGACGCDCMPGGVVARYACDSVRVCACVVVHALVRLVRVA